MGSNSCLQKPQSLDFNFNIGKTSKSAKNLQNLINVFCMNGLNLVNLVQFLTMLEKPDIDENVLISFPTLLTI